MAKEERGSYRAIPVVLLDGKDFHRLPERARWVFVALKMNLGPAGIEVHYPEALAHQLAAQTGAPVDGVRDSLDVIEAAGWIRREGNVVWIIEQLHFDPHMSQEDKKHRKSIQRHVASLPRLAIVDAFAARYSDWFLDDEGRPSQGPSEGHRSTDDREPNTDDRIPITENEPREAVLEIIIAANEGMADNKLIAGRFNPIESSGAGREIVREWLEKGIRPTTAASTCREVAQFYKPSGRNRQISGMAYFTKAVIEAHEREQIANGSATAGAGGSGLDAVGTTGRPGKFAAQYEHAADDAA